MIKSITSCLTDYITMDPITTLIIASLAGVCVVQIHMFYGNNNTKKKSTNKKETKKFIYTSEEEDMYLADNEDGPIWF